MSENHIMLLGAQGQVGQALQHEKLPADWQLHCHGRAELDITDHGGVKTALQRVRPALVINAAAVTAVDKAESDHREAVAVNFEGVANLAAQCAALDIPLIHLSTDYVFDGRDGNVPYTTENKMNPLSVYGQTKMMGEESIRHEHAWHVILRVSAVFSSFGKNILTNILKMIDERDELKFVIDQQACPTYAPDIAKALINIAEKIMGGKSNGFGLFHYCGSPETTRYEFVQEIMQTYMPYTQRRPKILPAKSTDFTGLAERPGYSVLDCSKIRDIYGIEQRPWREGLIEAMSLLMRDRRQVV